jgi:hypothetical protein
VRGLREAAPLDTVSWRVTGCNGRRDRTTRDSFAEDRRDRARQGETGRDRARQGNEARRRERG